MIFSVNWWPNSDPMSLLTLEISGTWHPSAPMTRESAVLKIVDITSTYLLDLMRKTDYLLLSKSSEEKRRGKSDVWEIMSTGLIEFSKPIPYSTVQSVFETFNQRNMDLRNTPFLRSSK
jgi:hypothetical protein